MVMTRHTLAKYAVAFCLSAGMMAQATPPALAQLFGELSPKQEYELGREAAAQVERQVPLVKSRSSQDYIQKLGARLARHSGRTDVPYRFRIIDDKEANAFALPGGFIYINRGLIQLARNESELAGVLAHEIAHVSERHSVEQLKKAQRIGLGLGILDLLLGRSRGTAENLGALAAGLVAQGVFFKYSRDAEREADQRAVDILRRAGINPNGMVTLFQRMESMRGSPAVNSFFSSHPSLSERQKNISGMLNSRDTRLAQDSNAFRKTKNGLGGDLVSGRG
jgi:beta-barrel assembly-enhancing protease